MTIEEFTTKWYSMNIPGFRNKVDTVRINGKLYDTVVFFIPKLENWKNKNQKRIFYKDCKKVGIIRMPGRKRKWYYKTW